jgi:hypothetical protein
MDKKPSDDAMRAAESIAKAWTCLDMGFDQEERTASLAQAACLIDTAWNELAARPEQRLDSPIQPGDVVTLIEGRIQWRVEDTYESTTRPGKWLALCVREKVGDIERQEFNFVLSHKVGPEAQGQTSAKGAHQHADPELVQVPKDVLDYIGYALNFWRSNDAGIRPAHRRLQDWLDQQLAGGSPARGPGITVAGAVHDDEYVATLHKVEPEPQGMDEILSNHFRNAIQLYIERLHLYGAYTPALETALRMGLGQLQGMLPAPAMDEETRADIEAIVRLAMVEYMAEMQESHMPELTERRRKQIERLRRWLVGGT